MTTPPIQTLTDELLGEIEAAASNATQDDWELIPGTKLSGPEVVANGEPIAWVLNSEADAVHIQMANPAIVIKLITELRTLRAQVKALQSDANSWQSGYDEGRRMAGKHRLSEIEQLRAENAELRKDAGQALQRIKELDLMFGRYLLAMKSAVIDSEQRGAEEGMRWIYNSLEGPGELPPEEEIDAQVFFDREIKPIDDAMREIFESMKSKRAAMDQAK